MHPILEEISTFLGNKKLTHTYLPPRGKTESNRFDILFGKDLKHSFTHDTSLTPEEFFKSYWELRISECKDCVLYKTRNHVVYPDGHFNAPIMVVLEGPGFLEDLSKTPLVSALELRNSHCNSCEKIHQCYSSRLIQTGKIWPIDKKKAVVCEPKYVDDGNFLGVQKYIRSTGTIVDGILLDLYGLKYPRYSWNREIQTSPWFITNVALCRSWNQLSFDDETPHESSLRECFKWFVLSYFTVKPKVTIVLGRIAGRAILSIPKQKLSKELNPNQIYDSAFGKVIYNTHPAHIMRSSSEEVKASLYARLGATFRIGLEEAGLEIRTDRIIV